VFLKPASFILCAKQPASEDNPVSGVSHERIRLMGDFLWLGLGLRELPFDAGGWVRITAPGM